MRLGVSRRAHLDATVVGYRCHDSDPSNLRYSTNGGLAFNPASWPSSLDVTTASDPKHVQSVHVDPYHRKTFYAAHSNGWAILKSTDGGATWKTVGALPGADGC